MVIISIGLGGFMGRRFGFFLGFFLFLPDIFLFLGRPWPNPNLFLWACVRGFRGFFLNKLNDRFLKFQLLKTVTHKVSRPLRQRALPF